MVMQNDDEEENQSDSGLSNFLTNPLQSAALSTAKAIGSVPWKDVGTGIKNLAPNMAAAALPAGMGGGVFNIDSGGSSDTAKMNGAVPNPPPQIINQDGKQYAFRPGEHGSMTATPQPPPAAAQQPLPGMPPGVSPDEIEGYLGKQRGQLAKYGADDQMAQQARINMSRNSLPYQVADAGKGFADALMTGVARAGNPNWQGQFEQQQNEAGNQNLATMRGANEANLKQTEAGMNLDKMDAKSTLSKSSQQTYAPLFQKLGYPPEAINKMSAANIENALGLMTQYGGEQVKAEIQKMQMQLELAKIQSMAANTRSEMGHRTVEEQQKDREMKLAHPISSMLFGGGNEASAPPASGWKYIGPVKG